MASSARKGTRRARDGCGGPRASARSRTSAGTVRVRRRRAEGEHRTSAGTGQAQEVGGNGTKARSVTWIRVCVARLLRHKPGVTPVRAFRDIRQDMGMSCQ